VNRAFIKDPDDAGQPEEVPERPQSPHPNYVTPVGLRQLEVLAAELSAHRDRLREAGKLADPQELATVQRDLRWVEGRLQRAIRVELTDQVPDQVRIGTSVEVQDEVGRIEIFSIVGEDEADAALGKISWVSPLAEALLHAEAGEEVVWRRPAGTKQLEVLAIRPIPAE
jgi:transcription elongation GreA/GreB family factor